MAMRVYTKFFLRRSASWEDYTCLLAWIAFIGYAAIAFEADKVGSGVHQTEIADDDLVKYAQVGVFKRRI
ncbi:hypothetical protein EYZ11_008807 [Aspergillus tanneri]|uniref:Rhodopsin domain-containing protein n=1 Tax=Aspergillus tanneri TaxID=1220188 RepID=A0A4S3J9I6_9EURO|nr:hypothetical protein EYZ11_008807 [Aspergillus tanneri]